MKTLGRAPSSPTRLQRFQNSPNYRDGVFHNIHPTPMSREGGSTFKTAVEFFIAKRPKDIKPSGKIAGIKRELHHFADGAPALVWFGHSSYLIQHQGKNYLIDPVFSGHASPFSSLVTAFEGTDLYTVADLPPIDVLILTHDHYDHIDFKTVTELRSKVKKVICPLGVGEHLEYWGFSSGQFSELDWWEELSLFADSKITATPARHFSGRSLQRNKTLWASYALELSSYRIFIGGDSGYDDQFKKIGEKFKSFDLALLECGQYGVNWPYIHMFPEQTAQAAVDLNAKMLFPVHWGKFVLSVHAWTEPVERVLIKAAELGLPVTTPQIGEVVSLGGGSVGAPQTPWWRDR